MVAVRVELPYHLCVLASLPARECVLDLPEDATITCLLDTLEEAFPALSGTVRDPVTRERRAYLRFFACQRDLSFDALDCRLPDAVLRGREPFILLGAVAGG